VGSRDLQSRSASSGEVRSFGQWRQPPRAGQGGDEEFSRTFLERVAPLLVAPPAKAGSMAWLAQDRDSRSPPRRDDEESSEESDEVMAAAVAAADEARAVARYANVHFEGGGFRSRRYPSQGLGGAEAFIARNGTPGGETGPDGGGSSRGRRQEESARA